MEIEIRNKIDYETPSPLKTYLLYAQDQSGEYNCDFADIYYIVGFLEDNKYVAVGLGSVYSAKHCIRNTCWDLHSNAERELWIDTLWSEKKVMDLVSWQN